MAPAAFLLNISGGGPVVVIGETTEPVTSAEGFITQPQKILSDLDPEQVSVLVIPGGTISEIVDIERLSNFVVSLERRHLPLGGICGGPGVFGKAGILANHQYTTTLDVAKYAFLPAETYVEQDLVIDRNLVTAKPYANVEFAVAIGDLIGLDQTAPVYRGALSSLRQRL